MHEHIYEHHLSTDRFTAHELTGVAAPFDYTRCDLLAADSKRRPDSQWDADHERPEAVDLCKSCGTEADRVKSSSDKGSDAGIAGDLVQALSFFT